MTDEERRAMGVKIVRAIMLTFEEVPENVDEKAGQVWDALGAERQELFVLARQDFEKVLNPPIEPPAEPKELEATLTTVKGDATTPVGEGLKFIVHCCNDVGAWGAGFVLALSAKWPETKMQYESWYVNTDVDTSSGRFALGAVQFLPVEDDIVVCNMIGQRGIKEFQGAPPIRYGAIETALGTVREKIEAIKGTAPETQISVHCPKFGAGLAGGDWSKIEPLLQRELVEHGISVTVYELK